MDVSQQARDKPLSAVSVYSYIPPRRHHTKEMSYFNTQSQVPEVSMYDRVHHQAGGYDMKLHRDDRQHFKGRGLEINKEEKLRVVPVLSSSEYGRQPVPALCQTSRQHARVACLTSQSFTRNGIVWTVAEGYGSVQPI